MILIYSFVQYPTSDVVAFPTPGLLPNEMQALIETTSVRLDFCVSVRNILPFNVGT